MDILAIFPWIVGIVIIGITILIIYFFHVKPQTEEPLPNERKLGHWTIWLKEHGVHAGYVTTAAQSLQALISDICKNETVKEDKTKLEHFRVLFSKFSPVAQRFDGKTQILMFTSNPEDQKFLALNPERRDGYVLSGVQDVIDGGDWSGMHFFVIKLSADFQLFNDKDKEYTESICEATKYLRDAARNVDRIKLLKDELIGEREEKEKAQKLAAKLRSMYDGACYALSQKPLSVEKPEVPFALKAAVQKWFGSPLQWVLGIAGFFFVGPYLLLALNYNWQPPLTTYFSVVVGVLLFFAIPGLKKVFGRWL